MFLETDSGILDLQLDLFQDVASALDGHISVVDKGSVTFEKADMMGLFDRAEHAAGLGFVACQAYLASTYSELRIQKVAALAAGPIHTGGTRVVALLNAAANFWKHNAEWVLQPKHSGRGQTIKALESLRFPVEGPYPLYGVLC